MKPKKQKQNNSSELLLEIGTEEIPWSYLEGLGDPERGLNAIVKTLLPESFRDEAEIRSFQTPCRIVLWVLGLPPFDERKEEVVGPRKEACYGSDGKPTAALQGFLKSKNAAARDLTEEKGRMVIRRSVRTSTETLLKIQIQHLVQLLSFPKMMRWNERDIRFPRPVRWLLCLYNGKVLPLSDLPFKADRKTFGLGPFKKPRSIQKPPEYFSFLKKEGILLEEFSTPDGEGERKRTIRKQCEQLVRRLGGDPARIDPALLAEVTNLVEKPFLFAGTVNKTYLDLPKEVLIASMAKYQRLFAVEDRRGKLLPSFIACANGRPSLVKIRKNYEQVLNARLEDAHFFFTADMRETLSRKRDRLKQLIYHRKLGTMFDKSERMAEVASALAGKVGVQEFALAQAARLAKNDLVTAMVKEFPSLQGVIGYYYARREGVSEEISRALWEQYLPKGTDAELPKTALGAALSFLEKLDHLTGFFHAGEVPTGSMDPYGLRRAANALFRILLERKWHLPFAELVEKNLERFSAALETRLKLHEFLLERLKSICRERGYRSDLVEAVSRDLRDPVETEKKLSSLSQMMSTQKETFLAAFKVVERTHNILKPVQPKEQQGLGSVRPDLFQDEIEKNLWNLYNTGKRPIEKLIAESAWSQATARYAQTFSETLHQFFDKVLVNVEDPGIRRNRLALMKEINELYTKPVADLSKLIIE